MKPKTAFLLLMATQVTRISNIMGMPRLFSPLFIEFILFFIIFFRMRKQFNFLTIAKHTRILILWIGFHMGWRLIQYFIYDDIVFVTFSSDLVNLYFKIFLFYQILIHFLVTENNFNKLAKYLTLNLVFLILFVYLELFFGIQYGSIFNTIIYHVSEIRVRFSQRLLWGPYEHWTQTGMVFATSLPLLIYLFNKNINKTLIYIGFLFITIVLIGSRAATLSAFVLIFIYLITRLNYKKGIIIFVFLLIMPFLQQSFVDKFDYYKKSFTLNVSSKNQGYNLTNRLFNTYLLVKNIHTVPFFGFGWRVRPIDNYNIREMPIKSGDMESNLFIQDIYDFGIIVGCITIIWIFSSTFFKVKQQKEYSYASMLSWLGFLIAGMSNINITFHLLIVPLSFYSWEKSKLLQEKLSSSLSIMKRI